MAESPHACHTSAQKQQCIVWCDLVVNHGSGYLGMSGVSMYTVQGNSVVKTYQLSNHSNFV